MIINMDCVAGMRLCLADNSVDAIVCDPPYELGFMGKAWDASGIANSVEMWREALRVLKPGGHLLAFSGSRTYHRMACAIEDAGFEVRDQIMWVYGSGFPKSLDVSKAIDKSRTEDKEPTRVICRAIRAAMDSVKMKSRDLAPVFGDCHPRLIDHWAARDTDSQPALCTWEQWQTLRAVLPLSADLDAEVWRLNGRKGQPGDTYQNAEIIGEHAGQTPGFGEHRFNVVDTSIRELSDAARQWEGWGTALKPAHEPICVARKPLIGTVAANVLAHGTGALNIGGCRVGDDVRVNAPAANGIGGNCLNHGRPSSQPADSEPREAVGRWPANLIHDGSDEVIAAFPDAGGQQGALTGDEPSSSPGAGNQVAYGLMDRRHASEPRREADKSAARFFYAAKASSAERNAGLDDHPTVKPAALMQYLCRLVTPPGGLVLDPFTGSGSTWAAAKREGFQFVGFELDPHYCEIAKRRAEAA
jgi:DNA modification methylase